MIAKGLKSHARYLGISYVYKEGEALHINSVWSNFLELQLFGH